MIRFLLTALGVFCLFNLAVPTGAEVHHDTLAGGHLNAAQAAELETKVAADPEDMAARSKLLGYYFTRRFGPGAAGEIRQKHILWIIEHHPEAEVAGTPYAQLDPSLDSQAYPKGKELWLNQAKQHSDNKAILEHAANFFLIFDGQEAERLLLAAQKLEPKNPHWAEALGHLYTLHPGKFGGDTKAAGEKSAAMKAFVQFESAYKNTSSRQDKFYRLSDLAGAAFEAGEIEKATGYATELLDMCADFPRDWNYGNAIHHGNLVLGRIALRAGDVEQASKYLLKAGKTPGSPQLNSFGPNMTLAGELLGKGEKKTVLEYFDLCGKFWKMGGERLEQWKKDVAVDKAPDFGGNLRY